MGISYSVIMMYGVKLEIVKTTKEKYITKYNENDGTPYQKKEFEHQSTILGYNADDFLERLQDSDKLELSSDIDDDIFFGKILGNLEYPGYMIVDDEMITQAQKDRVREELEDLGIDIDPTYIIIYEAS